MFKHILCLRGQGRSFPTKQNFGVSNSCFSLPCYTTLFGLQMPQSDLLNMPDYVYQLVVKQSMYKDCELIWTVGGHGRQVELVMKWFPRGSKWEEPFTEKSETSVRQKSKACIRRDTNRRKWYNVNRNSKHVETSDGECDNPQETETVGMSTPLRASTMDVSCETGVVDPDPAVVTHDQTCQTGVCEVEQPAVVMLDQTSDTQTQDSQQSHDNTSDNPDPDYDCELNKNDFHLFVRAIKDDDTNCIYALTKEGWIYKCDMSDTCQGERCSLLPRLEKESLTIGFLIRLSPNILETLQPPLLEYLVQLHSLACDDFMV